MRLSARHIGELVRELADLFVGARIRDVVALPPRDLVLALDPPGSDGTGAPERMLLSCDPDAPRLHRVAERLNRHKGPIGPFYRRLDDELPGRVLDELVQVDGDRIVRLALSGSGGSADRLFLVLELAGRHGNALLLDGAGAIVDLLAQPPKRRDEDGAPRLSIGATWSAPPGRPPADPGPPLAESFPLPDGVGAEELGRAPASRRLELTLGARARELRRARLAQELAGRIKRRRKTLERTLAGVESRRAAAADAERVQQDGELVKAAQGHLKRGLHEVELADWYTDGAPRRIALDPKLTPQENVARLFKRAKKLTRDAESVEVDRARAEEALEHLEALERDAADPAADLDALDARAVKAGLLSPRQDSESAKRGKPKPAARLPYRRFATPRGAEVLVGRSARDNDELSLKIGRGSDVWLHTADAPGSHVVLRCARGAEPDHEDVLDAAHLALHFSPLSKARKADIHVARCKHIKKPKGAKPGLVMLSGGKTLHLVVDRERLARLLDTRT